MKILGNSNNGTERFERRKIINIFELKISEEIIENRAM